MSFLVNPPFSGGTLTGPLTLPAGTLAAPSLLWTGAGSNTGFYSTGANNISVAVNGARAFYIESGVAWADGITGIGFTNNNAAFYFGGSGDLRLYRDAAATLAQRNGTNAQTFKVYGTTDAGLTNYERLAISAQQGVGFTIGAETLGTGADNLDISVLAAGTGKVRFHATDAYFDNGGYCYASGIVAGGSTTLNNYAFGFRVRSSGEVAWTSGAVSASVDSAFLRGGAGLIDVTNGTAGTYRDLRARNLITNPGKFAALVDAATAGKGARAFINDGAGAVFGVAAAGGGALNVPVYSDGTNWIVG